jgi:hypothetical protein
MKEITVHLGRISQAMEFPHECWDSSMFCWCEFRPVHKTLNPVRSSRRVFIILFFFHLLFLLSRRPTLWFLHCLLYDAVSSTWVTVGWDGDFYDEEYGSGHGLFKVLSQTWFEGLSKTMEIIGRVGWLQRRELNPMPAEYGECQPIHFLVRCS